MADLLLFGRLADARRARPRRFRLFNAHLDEYLSKSDVKSRFRFGRDSINYFADLLSDNLARNTTSKSDLKVHVLHYANELLVRVRHFSKLA